MKKILVIEDELDVRTNILELLEFENFEVIAAENGRVGVHLAQEQLPDLILCDVMMPHLDGYGVLEALRQDPDTTTIPFIFLTAKATKADLRQGMQLGADDYLTKPFTGEELLSAVKTRLEKQAAITGRYNLALKQAAERLNYLVNYDSVTNLPNRLLLQERFNRVLLSDENWLLFPDNQSQQLIPILCVSIDRFSWLNDTLGVTSGDLLLKAVADRLKTCVSSHDTVAHLNTAHFAVILASMGRLETPNWTVKQSAVAQAAQVILEGLSQPFLLMGREVFITASIGIALHPQDAQDIEKLIRYANAARERAKEQGGDNYQFYTAAIRVSSSDKLVLEANLRHAIERSELQVYYQPQIDLHTGYILGAEALVRWQHPERGLVSPAEFIPLAEETGLIVAIDQWVLNTACQQTRVWQQAGFSYLRIAVNLTARQFSQPAFSQIIAQLLQETRLEPGRLELELTESTLVQNPPAMIAAMSELRAIGVQISIDDFGTGYSSLNYLQRFSFNTLKIDRSFVHNINENSKNAAITTAIIQMAHSLKLQVIAEGVETPAELAFLQENQCNAMQGYLFSPPIPAEEFANLLMQSKRLSFSQNNEILDVS